MRRIKRFARTGLPWFALVTLLPLWGVLSSRPAIGQGPPGEESLTEAVSKAELAFYGQVSDVEYRLSREGVPHTFVTFRVQRLIRGRVGGAGRGRRQGPPWVTLRFIGGPKGNGSFLTVQGVPHFNRGDRDVLLVHNNGVIQCPLVRCERGRFRVLNNRVYSSRGIPVARVQRGRIVAEGRPEPQLGRVRYPRPTFDELYQREEVQAKAKEMGISVEELRRRYEKEAPKEIILEPTVHRPKEEPRDKSSEEAQPGEVGAARGKKASPMTLERFLEILSRAGKGAPAPAKAVVSLNPDEAFSFKLPTASPPGRSRNAAEEEKLRQQDFDPVIREKPPAR